MKQIVCLILAVVMLLVSAITLAEVIHREQTDIRYTYIRSVSASLDINGANAIVKGRLEGKTQTQRYIYLSDYKGAQQEPVPGTRKRAGQIRQMVPGQRLSTRHIRLSQEMITV